MAMNRSLLIVFIFFGLLFFGCATSQPQIPFDRASSQAGTHVAFKGNSVNLLGTPVTIGKPLPSVELVDAVTMKEANLSKERGHILLLSIVPSLDTPVCEEQAHYLGEKGEKLLPSIKRIVISRDTPFAQKRFAKEAKLTHLQYYLIINKGTSGAPQGF
jgi:thiol peroxidase